MFVLVFIFRFHKFFRLLLLSFVPNRYALIVIFYYFLLKHSEVRISNLGMYFLSSFQIHYSQGRPIIGQIVSSLFPNYPLLTLTFKFL
jgi:hypothetical protein